MKLHKYRTSYELNTILIDDIKNDPILYFQGWFKDAENDKNIIEPNAMTLSTVDEKRKPSSRVVLLKEIRDRNLIFYTNYKSKKGRDISFNPSVSLSFFWPSLERQVLITGNASKISESDSDEYFDSRPIGSKVGAIISNQSEEISDFNELSSEYNRLIERYKNQKIKRPKHWGGISVNIVDIEFWQGRPNRLHNRVKCKFLKNKWEIKLLSP